VSMFLTISSGYMLGQLSIPSLGRLVAFPPTQSEKFQPALGHRYTRTFALLHPFLQDLRCSRLLEPGSSTSFRLAGGRGAALLTKYDTFREDIQLGGVFEEYTKEHYDSWVAFARERGHPKDIKPILVTGVDMTRDFAMISYSNDGEDTMAEFTISARGVAFPWGNWRAPGVVYTNCGPRPCRPPSGNSHTETISEEYNQCVFIRYYTMRKRLGIPRVIKAAAGPHDLGPRGRDHEESPLEVEHNSESGSDISSLFDDHGEDNRSSVTSIDSEPDIVIHNTTLVCSLSRPFALSPVLIVPL